MISAGRFQPGYRVRVAVEYSAERIILCADGSPVVTSISGKIKILSKFRFGVGMIIDVYAAVYQPCKPCQLAWLAYQPLSSVGFVSMKSQQSLQYRVFLSWLW